jgi:hypothetical protein
VEKHGAVACLDGGADVEQRTASVRATMTVAALSVVPTALSTAALLQAMCPISASASGRRVQENRVIGIQ